jgi:hypothetical protein
MGSLRNVMVSTAGTYETDKCVGRIREGYVYATRAEAKYRLNLIKSISLGHNYVKRDSNAPSSSDDKYEVGIHVTAGF